MPKLRNLTVKDVERALNEALDSYENNRTWTSADIFRETAEAGGFMGSDSSYDMIARNEFARVLHERLTGAMVVAIESDG